MKSPLNAGDYVLATKYSDGDPCDHFCVGFFAGMLGDRYLVQDECGKSFRPGGFRRAERISSRVGDILVKAFARISDKPGRSLWYWRRHVKELETALTGEKDNP